MDRSRRGSGGGGGGGVEMGERHIDVCDVSFLENTDRDFEEI
jgi:hypothetical protein